MWIADTPVLKGMEALLFMQKMENVKPMSKKEKEQMRKDFELAKSRATFPL